MPLLKRIARRLVAYALYYTGLLWIYAEFRLRRKAVILMYHRVLPRDTDTYSHEGIVVTPRTFARQMKFLRRHFQPITPGQLGTQLRNQGFSRRACLVTFDDGWQDNYQYALAVLKQHSIPAVVFVTTAFIGTDKSFWQERLTRLLYAAASSRTFGVDVLRELNCLDACELSVPNAKRRLRDVVTSLKSLDPDNIERIIERLTEEASRCGIAPEGPGVDRFLSWTETLQLQESQLVTIGSHAHSHTPLTALGYEGTAAEFRSSQKTLAMHDIHLPTLCAYPNGNVDGAVRAAARDSGFALGFATGKGRTSLSDDALQLPRINIHESSSSSNAEFLCRILGVI